MKSQDVWFLFNLRSTPYSSDALRPRDGAEHPVDWFVGRELEVDRLVRVILYNSSTSRQAISGNVGVGRSTLVRRIKEILAPDKFYSNPDPVALGYVESTSEFCTRILTYVYETLLAAAREQGKMAALEKDEAMQETRQLIRAFREVTGLSGGVNIPVLGGGLSVGRSTSIYTPATALPSILIARLLRGLFRAAREHLNARGIVVYVNNLERLNEAGAEKASAIFRDVRDSALYSEGYHWIVVGTPVSLRAVVYRIAELRSSFFLPRHLDPLKPSELSHLLSRRYAALAADADKPVRAPITPNAIQSVYALFQGDLRNTLAALNDAAEGLLGYNEPVDAPLTLTDLHPFLRHHYEADIRTHLTVDQADKLEKLVRTVGAEPFSVKDAATTWMKERSRAARTLAEFRKNGYIVLDEKLTTVDEYGRPEEFFTASVTTLLAFGVRELFDVDAACMNPLAGILPALEQAL